MITIILIQHPIHYTIITQLIAHTTQAIQMILITIQMLLIITHLITICPLIIKQTIQLLWTLTQIIMALLITIYLICPTITVMYTHIISIAHSDNMCKFRHLI